MKKRKLKHLKSLARQDDLSNLSRDYNHVADYYEGIMDVGIGLSPSSIHSNVDAKYMLVAQDWSSSDTLENSDEEGILHRAKTGRGPKVKTNELLDSYVRDCDIEGETYLANAFGPFIKKGSMNAPIPDKDIQYCVENYVSKEVEIQDPEVVLLLGKKSADAFRKYHRVDSDCEDFSDQSGRRYVVLPHPGMMGTNLNGGYDKVLRKWKQITA